MRANRPERVADLLVEVVSRLLATEVEDPRVRMVTLTAAELSRDLRHARIYFSHLQGGRSTAEVLSGLRSATGFIRSKVARELKLRIVPEIEFVYDATRERAERIEDLLRQIKR